MADSYPVLFRDDFSVNGNLSSDTNYKSAITGNAPATASKSGGVLTLDPAGAASANSRRVYMLDPSVVTNVAVKGKMARFAFTMGTVASQFFTGYVAINTDGTTIAGAISLVRGTSSLNLQRRRNTTSSSGPTADLLDSDTPTLTAAVAYILEMEDHEVVAATSSRYYGRVRLQSDESIVSGSEVDSGTVSNSTTDTGAYAPGFATQESVTMQWWEVLNIAAPNITAQPVDTTENEGDPASFAITSVGGRAGTSPGTETDLAWLWQFSDDGGVTPQTYSGGSGGTTDSLTTANTTLSMDGYLFRCRVTDTGNSEENFSEWAELTVAPVGPPVPSAGSTNTGGSTITIPFTENLTLNNSSAAFWTVEKNGGTTVGITSVAVANLDEILLTLSGRVKDSDTGVVVSFAGGANVLEGPSGDDVVAFDDLAITNNSNVDFSVSVPTPYDEAIVERGYGYIKIRVAITRANDTDSLTLSCPGLDAKLNAVFTQPGTGSVGYVDLSADSDATLDPTGSAITITVTDAYSDARSDTTNLKVVPNLDLVPPSNVFSTPFLGSSTPLFVLNDGGFALWSTLFAAPNAVTFTPILEMDGGFCVGGTFVEDFVPGSASGVSPGVMHRAILWIKENQAFIASIIVPYSNNVAALNEVWANVSAESILILQYLADNCRKTLVYPATGRYNGAPTVTGNVTAVNGGRTTITVTVSTGTLDSGEIGDYLLLPRSDGYRTVALITGVSGTDITVSAALPAEALTNSTFTITPDLFTTNIGGCNGSGPTTGVQTLCAGGTSPIVGTGGGVVRFKETNAIAVNVFELDNIHLAPAPALTMGADMRDDHLAPEILEDATLDLTVNDPTIPPLGVAQLTPDVDLDEYGFTACPGGLLNGNGSAYAIDSGDASVDTDGEVTAGATEGTVVARFTMGYIPFGGSPLTDAVNIQVSADSGNVAATGSQNFPFGFKSLHF